ncbi:MAG TPA: HNH endonuclease [Candidatus Yaniella excrementigallinarum]|nr:HNH endonuclease [Candidatus Yaniella excrementigallinarum]
MTTATDLLDDLDLPCVDGRVDWDSLTSDELFDVVRNIYRLLDSREPDRPTDGVLQRSLQLEETWRTATALQHRYAGLLQDAYNSADLRTTIGLPKGKTPFRDGNDLIAKTHGIRAYEASGRTKIAAAMTPARDSDPNRDENISVGQTLLPLLGALQSQGRVHPTKLASAVNMIDDIDQAAEVAGKDQGYRDQLRSVIEKDLVEKIQHTTPEEFSRYVGRRKKDLLAALDPVDKQFTKRQTDAMHNVWCEGPVRGNPNAFKWSIITDAEGNETFSTIEAMANNPRAKDDDTFDSRTRGQRSMHAFRDALKFALANLEHSELRGANGAHTQMVIIGDYPTLIQGLRTEMADVLPEIQAEKREKLLALLAEGKSAEADADTLLEPNTSQPTSSVLLNDATVKLPAPKTDNPDEILQDENLNRLQSRISQGIYTPYIPPNVLLRLLCDVSVSPVTLTGNRQVLSIGRKQRQFSESLRRAILARDRGCAVPGCHWPAAWCELHHIKYWSQNGKTSTENGVMICAHHHQALHAKMLQIERVNGEIRFKLHPMIDPAQETRKNYFWQN